MSIFRFKQFNISQDNAAMKVGTDAMLLGAFVPAQAPKRILDVGCGTGIIGLMLAQRFPSAFVHLIENDTKALVDANLNCSSAPFVERLKVFDVNFLKYRTNLRYDLIVSNPPYHTETPKAQGESRQNARNANALQMDDFFKNAVTILADKGSIALITPFSYLDTVTAAANLVGLKCKQILHILPKATKACNRTISIWTYTTNKTKIQSLILRTEDNLYTSEYRALTKDFHTIF